MSFKSNGPVLTATLLGKQIAEAMCNGNTLLLRCADGSEWEIDWVNEDTGVPIKGRPVIRTKGFRLKAKGIHDLIVLPRGI